MRSRVLACEFSLNIPADSTDQEDGECGGDFVEISNVVSKYPFQGSGIDKGHIIGNPLNCEGLFNKKSTSTTLVADCAVIWLAAAKAYPYPFFIDALSNVDFSNSIAQHVAIATLLENPALLPPILEHLFAQNCIEGIFSTYIHTKTI